jgi:hypothetical protein
MTHSNNTSEPAKWDHRQHQQQQVLRWMQLHRQYGASVGPPSDWWKRVLRYGLNSCNCTVSAIVVLSYNWAPAALLAATAAAAADFCQAALESSAAIPPTIICPQAELNTPNAYCIVWVAATLLLLLLLRSPALPTQICCC